MAVNARGLYVCTHCGTTTIPEGAKRDGLQLLDTNSSGWDCPQCGTRLTDALLDEYTADACRTCRGILLPRRSFAEIVRRRRAWAKGESVVPVPPDEREMRRAIACPKCRSRMITDHYYGPGNVVLDRCTACDVLWLDYGELEQIIDAPGADRGSRDLT
jgi:Zn-finger nucleic acid-binding protein